LEFAELVLLAAEDVEDFPVVVGLLVVAEVVVAFGFTICGDKSGCPLSINHGIVFAFSSVRFIKTSCPF
jgi:hypothetical protein